MFRLRSLAVILAVFSWLNAASTAHGQEPIRFARTPDISPDGKLVAFSYLGDIWIVEAIGGVARPVTMHEAHDINPAFSPDGKIARLLLQPPRQLRRLRRPRPGRQAARLTFDSADDYVNGWSPDGKSILFASNRGTGFPQHVGAVHRALRRGPGQRVSAFEGRDGVFSPEGDLIAYVRGPGTWYRKGYRGSANDDVWIANADGCNNRRLTSIWDRTTRRCGPPTASRSTTSATPATARQPRQHRSPGNRPRRRRRPRCHRAAGADHLPQGGIGPPGPHQRQRRVDRLRMRRRPLDRFHQGRASPAPAPPASSPSRSTPTTRPIPTHRDLYLRHDRIRHVAMTKGLSPSWFTARFSDVAGGGKAKRLTDSPAYDHSPLVA